MPTDVRMVIVAVYCMMVSAMLSLSPIHPLKSVLFSLLTSAALFLVLERFPLFTNEQED